MSMTALHAPRTSRHGASTSGCGASTTRLTARVSATPPTSVIRREPYLTIAWPANGVATMTAIDIAMRTTPSVALERSKRSCVHGICATQVPITAPLTKNMPVVAQRRLMRGSP